MVLQLLPVERETPARAALQAAATATRAAVTVEVMAVVTAAVTAVETNKNHYDWRLLPLVGDPIEERRCFTSQTGHTASQANVLPD